MKKKLYILVCIIFLSVFVLTYTVQGATVEEIFEEKKNEIRDKIDNTSAEIQRVDEEISEVEAEVNELSEKIAKYQQEINQLNVQALQLEANMNETQRQLKQTEENYAKEMKLLQDRVVAMYKSGETVYLDVLLKSSSIGDFLSKFYYLTEVTKKEKLIADQILKDKQEIEVKKERLLNQQEQLQIITTNKERTEITLKNAKVVRDSHLSQLNETQQKNQEDLKTYETEMEELEQDILNVSLSSLNSGYIGGNLVWPAPGYRTITSPYGMRIHPIFHVLRLHTGVDIGAPEGANIVAANSGVVTLAQYSTSYGNYVMIDHGGGIVTLYAHGLELVAHVGDIVKAGDVIMKCGTTGWSTGAHLHFEIRINGDTVNPLPYITNSSENNLNNISNSDINYSNDIANLLNTNMTNSTQN